MLTSPAMASLLKSEAAFRERAAECGLNQAEIDRLVDNGMSSLATLAYSLTVPGTPPTEQSLRSLLNEPDPASVPLRAQGCVGSCLRVRLWQCLKSVQASSVTERRELS